MTDAPTFSNPKLVRLVNKAKREGRTAISMEEFVATHPPAEQSKILEMIRHGRRILFAKMLGAAMDSGALTEAEAIALANEYRGTM